MIKYTPPKSQLLKWVGNKQKFAAEITSYFPSNFNKFIEPFLGSGAILATVSPLNGFGSDIFSPLMEIWKELTINPNGLVEWYKERREQMDILGKEETYNKVRHSYNTNPNGADFLYLSRSCYGGVIRFRKSDGYMSTPCGVHNPISVDSFNKRVKEWNQRLTNVTFDNLHFRDAFSIAKKNDLIYCDPPYSHSQGILYGAQMFDLEELFIEIEKAKSRGVMIALSIDGNKKSGNYICDLPIPKGLFKREIYINCGNSMLKRFQLDGKTIENENVQDRLLLTY